jgi:uncharacterized membrane protein (DUF485 family)
MAVVTTRTREMLDSPAFRRMVVRRWQISIALLIALFVIYYGYILLVALNKPVMAMKIGAVTTLGIPLGVAVIVLSWILTAVYVSWANTVYDNEVKRLRELLRQ